jgi:hypothetical protein
VTLDLAQNVRWNCLALRRGRSRAGSVYRMNCFRHPDESAIVFCRACRHGLCRQCSQQSIRGVTHVCSDECARTIRRRPAAKGLFDVMYAGVFLIVLLAVLGGGICAWLASSGRFNWELQLSEIRNGYYARRLDGLQDDVYRIFQLLGIEDWRIQFTIGAAVGIGCAIVWLRRYWRPTTPYPGKNSANSVGVDCL